MFFIVFLVGLKTMTSTINTNATFFRFDWFLAGTQNDFGLVWRVGQVRDICLHCTCWWYSCDVSWSLDQSIQTPITGVLN